MLPFRGVGGVNKVTYWIKIVINQFIYFNPFRELRVDNKIKAYGQLVLLGFDVTTFTPAAYQRSSLLRPLKVNSS
jgi:hypothetical protein